MSAVSSRMTALREQHGWSKTYVAKQLHMNLSTYANYEYGNREPDINTLADIAKLFDVTTDYLLTGKKSEKQSESLSLDEALDSVMSFDGRPVTEHDRQMMKSLWKSYLENKD